MTILNTKRLIIYQRPLRSGSLLRIATLRVALEILQSNISRPYEVRVEQTAMPLPKHKAVGFSET
jgi:hypothetical protein